MDVPSSGGRLESYAEAAGSQLPPQVSLAKSKPEIGPVSLKVGGGTCHVFVEPLVHQLNQGHTVDVQARDLVQTQTQQYQLSSDTKETLTENPTGPRTP